MNISDDDARRIAKAQQHEQGKNTLKGAAIVLGILAAIFLYGFFAG